MARVASSFSEFIYVFLDVLSKLLGTITTACSAIQCFHGKQDMRGAWALKGWAGSRHAPLSFSDMVCTDSYNSSSMLSGLWRAQGWQCVTSQSSQHHSSQMWGSDVLDTFPQAPEKHYVHACLQRHSTIRVCWSIPCHSKRDVFF